MIRHPMQKCPAEFVPVFQEILEKFDWTGRHAIHICYEIPKIRMSNDQKQAISDWIASCLDGCLSFGGWLMQSFPDICEDFHDNLCRKAWLEWLVSPEGHE